MTHRDRCEQDAHVQRSRTHRALWLLRHVQWSDLEIPLPGSRRERPSVPIREDRLESTQSLSLREAQDELPDVFAEIFAIANLAPVLAVVDDVPAAWRGLPPG